MRPDETNTGELNQTPKLNLECSSANHAARGVRRALAIVWASARLLFLMLATAITGDPASASAPDARARWSIVPSPNEEGVNWLAAIDASAANDAWAVGYYIGDDGIYKTLSAHWDGSAWTLVETLNMGRQTGDWLYGVATVSASETWAVGYTAGPWDTYTSTTLVEHWTGAAWSVVPSPNPSDDPVYGANQLYDVRAFAPNNVWAVGWQWTEVGSAPLVVRWDGHKWNVSPTPKDEYRQLVALDGTSSSDIWAVGHSLNFNDGHQALAMHWDGRTWAIVPTPILAGDIYLTDVSVVSSTDVWAVGYSLPVDLDVQPLFLHWNGLAWSVVPSPHLSSSYNYLQSIAAVSSNRVWAAGYRTVNGHHVISLVERWDGTQWRVEATPNRPDGGNYLFDLTVDPTGGLWSAGYFYPDDSSNFQTLIQHRSP